MNNRKELIVKSFMKNWEFKEHDNSKGNGQSI